MADAAVDVYFVDDDQAVRSSLCWLIESADYVATACASAEEFLASFHPTGPCCVVTDVRMPGIDGITLLEKIVAQHHLVPVVVITAHGDIKMAVDAMKNGAFDFVEKPFDEKTLLAVVERAVQESIDRHGRRASEKDVWVGLESLSPREHQVLDRLVEGRSNRLVAKDLRISEKTVEAHRAHIMEKMDATSFADLISRVVKARLKGEQSI